MRKIKDAVRARLRLTEKYLTLLMLVAMMTCMLTACRRDTTEDNPVPSPDAATSEVTDRPTLPTPTPTPERDNFEVGEVIWGPNTAGQEEITTGDPTFQEKLLLDQSHAAEYADIVYQCCDDVPPALAAAASAFPSITAGCYLGTTDPVVITEKLYHDMNGGAIQRKLLSHLRTLLDNSDGTTLEVVSVSGLVRMSQAYVIEPNGPYLTILGFSWSDPILLDDAIQLKITRQFADGTTEVGYFDGNYCCLSVPVDDGLVG